MSEEPRILVLHDQARGVRPGINTTDSYAILSSADPIPVIPRGWVLQEIDGLAAYYGVSENHMRGMLGLPPK